MTCFFLRLTFSSDKHFRVVICEYVTAYAVIENQVITFHAFRDYVCNNGSGRKDHKRPIYEMVIGSSDVNPFSTGVGDSVDCFC